MNYLKNNKKRGFTLVETLTAITILLLSITGPMILAKQGIVSSRLAKKQIVASFLSQEAIEYIRNVRDSNIMADNNPFLGLENCQTGKCTIDVVTNQINSCITDCSKIRESSGGLMGYNPSWTETDFRRDITLTVSPLNSDEAVADIVIYWENDTKSFSVRESLFDLR